MLVLPISRLRPATGCKRGREQGERAYTACDAPACCLPHLSSKVGASPPHPSHTGSRASRCRGGVQERRRSRASPATELAAISSHGCSDREARWCALAADMGLGASGKMPEV